jgi:hypothetical protein
VATGGGALSARFLGKAIQFTLQASEDRVRIKAFGIVDDRLLPRLAKMSEALLSQIALVRPVAESVADDLAVGGVFANVYGATNKCRHFSRKSDAQLLDGRHEIYPSSNRYYHMWDGIEGWSYLWNPEKPAAIDCE